MTTSRIELSWSINEEFIILSQQINSEDWFFLKLSSKNLMNGANTKCTVYWTYQIEHWWEPKETRCWRHEDRNTPDVVKHSSITWYHRPLCAIFCILGLFCIWFCAAGRRTPIEVPCLATCLLSVRRIIACSQTNMTPWMYGTFEPMRCDDFKRLILVTWNINTN